MDPILPTEGRHVLHLFLSIDLFTRLAL